MLLTLRPLQGVRTLTVPDPIHDRPSTRHSRCPCKDGVRRLSEHPNPRPLWDWRTFREPQPYNGTIRSHSPSDLFLLTCLLSSSPVPSARTPGSTSLPFRPLSDGPGTSHRPSGLEWGVSRHGRPLLQGPTVGSSAGGKGSSLRVDPRPSSSQQYALLWRSPLVVRGSDLRTPWREEGRGPVERYGPQGPV